MPHLNLDTTPTRRAYSPPEELWPLFMAIAQYRVLTVPQAHRLVLRNLENGRSERTARARVQTLVNRGFLSVATVPAAPPVRFLHLTRAAFSRFPALDTIVTDHARKPPTMDLLIHAWHRVALAVAAQDAGFTVGRDLAALTALRRFLVDTQTAHVAKCAGHERVSAEQTLQNLRQLPMLQPWVALACTECGLELGINTRPPACCPECGGGVQRHVVATPYACSRCGMQAERGGAHLVAGQACTGVLRKVDYLAFDLAWKRSSAGFALQVLWADNPYRSLSAQLEALPLRVLGQPKVEIVLRPTDDGSVFDRHTSSYAVCGPRFRAQRRAFSERGNPDAFPFWSTAEVASDAVYPEAHFRVLHQRENP